MDRLIVRVALLVVLFARLPYLHSQDDANKIRLFGAKVKANHDLIRTWSSRYDVTSEILQDRYLVIADGKDKWVEAVVVVKSEAAYSFHFDCNRDLVHAKYVSPVSSLVDANKNEIERRPSHVDEIYLMNSSGFYELSRPTIDPEKYQMGLRKRPLSDREKLSVFHSFFHPNEFFRISGNEVWDLMDRWLPADCTLTENEDGLVHIAGSHKSHKIAIVLDKAKGGNPVSCEIVFTVAVGESMSRKWDYVSVKDIWIPSQMEMQEVKGGKIACRKVFSLVDGSAKINEPIDEKLFAEEVFGMRDYDRFYDSVTKEETQYYKGEKVPVSPLAFDSREESELTAKKDLSFVRILVPAVFAVGGVMVLWYVRKKWVLTIKSK